MLGVTPQAVCKWEQNLCYPDIFTLPHLARILGCQTDDFFRLPSRCEPPVDENFIFPIDNC